MKNFTLQRKQPHFSGPHIVIVPGTNAPSVIHGSFWAAEREAERLAQKLGLACVVLPAVANAIVYPAQASMKDHRPDVVPSQANPKLNDFVAHRFLRVMNEQGMVTVVG